MASLIYTIIRTLSQQVQRWRKKYDGTVQSLANKSRRPHSHPNQHTQEELDLIKQKYRYHSHEGYAQVYRKLMDAGYTRTYDSMCRQIRKMKLNVTKKRKSYPKTRYNKTPATYPGERVQIDVKFVPNECIGFASNHSRYYQITAIDEYSRKRYLELVEENSTYTTWPNGIVERSHRLDSELFYNKRRFESYKQMQKAFRRYSRRYNNIARKVLNFKTPNEMIEDYFSENAA